MSKPVRKIALIPAYRPEDKLIRLAFELRKKGFSVVIVDDGSGDSYRYIFNKAKRYAHVISYQSNHGKGYALKTGLHFIMRKCSEEYVVVTVDADGQHNPSDAYRIACCAEKNRKSLILGVRKLDKGNPLRSRFGNSITKSIFRVLTGINVSDTQTGLRSFSSEMTEYFAGISGNRYEYEMNMLLNCARDNIDITEIPVKTIYIGNNETSHFKPLSDSLRIYHTIVFFRRKRNFIKI